MWTHVRPITAAAASLAILLACADGVEEPADDGDLSPESPAAESPAAEDPETETPEPTLAPAPGATDDEEAPQVEMPPDDAELVEEMLHESSVGWQDHEVVSETELRFSTTSGNQACYGQRYQVEETEDEVAVAIIVGNRPDGAEICTQEAIFIAVPVELAQPLGARAVVELQDPELND